jgi:hypothetical protein
MFALRSTILACFVALMVSSVHGFAPLTPPTKESSTQLNNFFKNAFANEDLGPRENAGLKNGPKYNEATTVNGKPVKNAVVGQKLTAVANLVRVKIP